MRTSERDGLYANRMIALSANSQLCGLYFQTMWRADAVTIRDRKIFSGRVKRHGWNQVARTKVRLFLAPRTAT